MKKVTLFFTLFIGLGLTSLQAQSSAKTASACCKKSASVTCADKAHADGSADAAAKLASLDKSIEAHTCEKSGTVNYVRKEKDPATGNVIFTSLEYNSESGQFVNVSPSDKKACCTGDKKSCCSSKMKASSADTDKGVQEEKQVKNQKGS
jgi:hypothetical protein